MKKGINYDTGFLNGPERSRQEFDRETARREMRVIAGELHCRAVRVSGGDLERLGVAAEEAAAAGLEVWFAPFPVDLPREETLALYAGCAARAETLRRGGAEVVLVTGCETSAFGPGFIPGDTYRDRLQAMVDGDMAWWRSLGEAMPRFNAFLAEAAATVRPLFGGRVTYAAGPWEFVDWGPFDLVGVDAYRAAHNAATFREELRGHVRHGKPVAVTEFGTCAYRGAGERGGMAWVVPDGAVLDEEEQVRYLDELLDAFEEAGVDTALWFTFAGYGHAGAGDIGSYGVVRMLDRTRWEPKKVFHAMAARYARD
ncbi:hypothetical protein HTZ77_08390 [Nonomuraea sp. SMC257]|uniref:Abortive infection protein n=1 Tax=Nonomuraea montanisoli TaxID=2741721 RepID=A0A7Y6M2F4_9ACTN|nr:hypothetical protein [Nonomuraea montanisoli]NUW31441.1 hypothetical protein [Nonomuraea montanisoli]